MPKTEGDELRFEFLEMGNGKRLQELILYISDKCAEDPTFGATKLNKILYFSDFMSYRNRGAAITGVEYQRLRRGPAPKQLLPIRKQMIADGELALKRTKIYQREQHRTIPLREANLDDFSGSDIALVDEIIHALWGRTADEVSALSHDAAWRTAGNMESIPYQAAYLSDEGVTPDDIQRAAEIAEEISVSVPA